MYLLYTELSAKLNSESIRYYFVILHEVICIILNFYVTKQLSELEKNPSLSKLKYNVFP